MDNAFTSPGRGLYTLDLERRADGRIEERRETLAGRGPACSTATTAPGG